MLDSSLSTKAAFGRSQDAACTADMGRKAASPNALLNHDVDRFPHLTAPHK